MGNYFGFYSINSDFRRVRLRNTSDNKQQSTVDDINPALPTISKEYTIIPIV